MCHYCLKHIEYEEPGWGYMFEDVERLEFHSECLEVTEGVEVEA